MHKVQNNEGINKKKKKGIVHMIALVLFCMVLSIGTVCFADEVPGTVTVESAKIRASADPNSEQLGSAKQGGTVSIIGQTTGTDGKIWYQVFVDANTKGFIRADLVNPGAGTITTLSNTDTTPSTTTTTPATDLPETSVTSVDRKAGTVITNNVRIRQGASTDYDVVATANRGMVVTVTGEAAGTDGKTWYQIAFSYNNKEITGFIRSDLVTFDELPADTAVSTITGTEEPEEPQEQPTTEEATEPQTEETQQTQEVQEPVQTQSNTEGISGYFLRNADENNTPYIMPEFVPTIVKWEDENYNAFHNGDFYIVYAQNPQGEEGWYVFDFTNRVFQRYVYAAEGVTTPSTSIFSAGLIPIIILVIVIVMLLAVIGLLYLKLREYTIEEYDEEDDEDEEYSEEEEEIELLEEEPEYEEPVRSKRRPAPQPQQDRQSQPPRRPQPEQSAPARRPQGQRPQQGNPNGAPARRPQGEQNGQPQGTPRRPQQGNPNGAPAKRPQGNPNAGQSQPRNANRPAAPQKGYKAKNFLETNEDDMEFIDL